jgi:hypothetical protein
MSDYFIDNDGYYDGHYDGFTSIGEFFNVFNIFYLLITGQPPPYDSSHKRRPPTGPKTIIFFFNYFLALLTFMYRTGTTRMTRRLPPLGWEWNNNTGRAPDERGAESRRDTSRASGKFLSFFFDISLLLLLFTVTTNTRRTGAQDAL